MAPLVEKEGAVAPHARLPLVGECFGGLSVGTGYQSLASVRPGRTCNKHTHTHTHMLTTARAHRTRGNGMRPQHG